MNFCFFIFNLYGVHGTVTGAEAAADANTFVHSGSGTEKLLGEIIENFAFSREKAGFVSYAQSFKVFYYKLFVVAGYVELVLTLRRESALNLIENGGRLMVLQIYESSGNDI